MLVLCFHYVCIISNAFVNVNYDEISTDTCVTFYKMYNKMKSWPTQNPQYNSTGLTFLKMKNLDKLDIKENH